MTNLYLIRHGEAVCNVKPIIGGMQGDTGLTQRGRAQAEALRDRLTKHGEITADVLIASTLPRARETAEIVAPAFGLPIMWDDDVQEMRVGDADGLTHKDSWDKYGVPTVDFDPFRPIAPGGENWSQFMLRVACTIHRIINQHQDKNIVIVCHGGVIDGSFAYFLNINTRAPLRLEFYPHNTSITHWEQYTFYKRRQWRLISYNDVAHLRDIGAEMSPIWSADPSNKEVL